MTTYSRTQKIIGTVVLGAIPSNSLNNSFKNKFGLIEQGDNPENFY